MRKKDGPGTGNRGPISAEECKSLTCCFKLQAWHVMLDCWCYVEPAAPLITQHYNLQLVLLAEVCHFASGNCQQLPSGLGRSWQNKQSVRLMLEFNILCTLWVVWHMVESEASTLAQKGRPPPQIVAKNFHQTGKVNNKSNRWYYKCIHCSTNGTSSRIEGRDNNHICHLTDPVRCPNVPPTVRNAAWTYLATKGVEVALPSEVSISDSPTIGPSSGKSVKRQSSLLGYVDSPLTKAQQEHANIKLFRCITEFQTTVQLMDLQVLLPK